MSRVQDMSAILNIILYTDGYMDLVLGLRFILGPIPDVRGVLKALHRKKWASWILYPVIRPILGVMSDIIRPLWGMYRRWGHLMVLIPDVKRHFRSF